MDNFQFGLKGKIVATNITKILIFHLPYMVNLKFPKKESPRYGQVSITPPVYQSLQVDIMSMQIYR
jgi:hypothetical protein